eukprot:8804812-Heterocapsa_arctica.AAC.1
MPPADPLRGFMATVFLSAADRGTRRFLQMYALLVVQPKLGSYPRLRPWLVDKALVYDCLLGLWCVVYGLLTSSSTSRTSVWM